MTDKWEEKFVQLETKYKRLEEKFFEQFEKCEKEKRYNDELFYENTILHREIIDLKAEISKHNKGNDVEVVEHDG